MTTVLSEPVKREKPSMKPKMAGMSLDALNGAQVTMVFRWWLKLRDERVDCLKFMHDYSPRLVRTKESEGFRQKN